MRSGKACIGQLEFCCRFQGKFPFPLCCFDFCSSSSFMFDVKKAWLGSRKAEAVHLMQENGMSIPLLAQKLIAGKPVAVVLLGDLNARKGNFGPSDKAVWFVAKSWCLQRVLPHGEIFIYFLHSCALVLPYYACFSINTSAIDDNKMK